MGSPAHTWLELTQEVAKKPLGGCTRRGLGQGEPHTVWGRARAGPPQPGFGSRLRLSQMGVLGRVVLPLWVLGG